MFLTSTGINLTFALLYNPLAVITESRLDGDDFAPLWSCGRRATGATRHRVQPRLEDASLQSLATDWELICLTPLLRSPCTCVLSFQGGVRLHLYLQPSSLPSPSYPGLCAVQCGVSDLSGLRGPRRSLAGTALQLLSFVALVPAPAFWLTPNRTCFGCLPGLSQDWLSR